MSEPWTINDIDKDDDDDDDDQNTVSYLQPNECHMSLVQIFTYYDKYKYIYERKLRNLPSRSCKIITPSPKVQLCKT